MKIKNLLLAFLLLASLAGNVNAQAKSNPIVQDFESAVYPDGMQGWTYYCDDDDDEHSYGAVSSKANHTQGGTNCFYFDGASSAGYLISPPLNFDGGIDFSFFYTNLYEGAVNFEFGYSMTDIQGGVINYNSFTWTSINIPEEPAEWTQYPTVVLPSGVKRIVIALPADELYLFVDDIYIGESFGCPTPSALSLSTSSKTSLGLSWIGDSDSYELRYKPGFRNTFEYGIEGWTTIDADGDDYNWTVGNDPEVGSHEGNYYISSESYHDDGTTEPEELEPDNYLVSPLVQLGDCDSITFWAKAREIEEYIGVAISTSGNTSNEDFTTIEDWMVTDDWMKYTVDLTGYSGVGYIAIRHFLCEEDCVSQWELCLDDVTIYTSEWIEVTGITNTTYTLNGLTFETNYAIQVRGDCGSGNISAWSDEFYAMTSNADCRFVNAGKWDVASNWRNNLIPTANSDVAIAAADTIPANCLAQSNNINLSMGSITIQDGGQLKMANQVKGTMQKSITGYGEGSGNYYLLASPTNGQISSFTNFQPIAIADIDWYEFNQAADANGNEWINKKVPSGATYMIPGQAEMRRGEGYLYARKEDVTLGFVSSVINNPNTNTSTECYLEPTNETFTVPTNELDYSENADWAGWNLVGNPFTCDAYLNRTYFRMNEAGDAIVEGDGAIKPCEGVFVVVTAENKVVTFSDTPANTTQSLSLNLNGNNGLMDRVSLHFDGSNNIKKFVLNENATKLYIQQGTTDYAVVSSNGEGEMPVSFKASKNGTYTLSINAENVEMNYLHLIDNKTGADVDLLATPSYSFEAKTTDYASRFRLVFNANNGSNENGNETFAYYNGSEWMINNMGEATLQVVDVMGRVLSTETVSGNTTINLNQMPGVYMLRLVSGDSVKVQKVVVR